MTNEHYLEVAKECGARPTFHCGKPDECPDDDKCCHMNTQTFNPMLVSHNTLDAYTTRILAEKDAEIERYKRIESKVQSHITDIEQRLSAANAAIAIKDEALKVFIANGMKADFSLSMFKYRCEKALSPPAESIAAWEAEKQAKWNEESNSLIGQLEIEVEALKGQIARLRDALVDATGYLPVGMYQTALSNTQATAEAYDREHAAKVLEEYANGWDTDIAQEIRQDAAELRAANKKESE